MKLIVLYYETMNRAAIHEVFSSIQGEGIRIGERHIFVRFLGCDLRCRYCDTPAAVKGDADNLIWKYCRFQISAGSKEYGKAPNPVSSSDLTSFCTRLIIPGPSRPTLSLTGGEPLLHSSFLAAWLPSVRSTFKIYLETNGIHAGAMRDLRDLVDVVSMDFKLPSATGLKPFWTEHRDFLSAASGKEVFVKAVVTNNTTHDEILSAVRIIAESEASIPFVIQPADSQSAPESSLLLELQEHALKVIHDVRIIPQAHKMLRVP